MSNEIKPSAAADRPRFYRVDEVAKMFRMSPMTLYRAIEAGEFPAVRVRTRLMIPAKAIDDIEAAAVDTHAVVRAEDFTTPHTATHSPSHESQ